MIDSSNVNYLIESAQKNDKQSLKWLESELRRQRRIAKAQISKRNKEIEKSTGTMRSIIEGEKKLFIKQVKQYEKLIEVTQQARKTGKKIPKSAFYTISAERTAQLKLSKGFENIKKAREAQEEVHANYILYDFVLKKDLFNLDEQGLAKVQRELKKIGFDYTARLKEEFKKLPKDWMSDQVAEAIENVNAEAIEQIEKAENKNQKLIDIANYLKQV